MPLPYTVAYNDHGQGLIVPWITECRRCHTVACRGMRYTCQITSRRTPRGRPRLCQGELVRREDLEDACRTAGIIGGQEAIDAMIANIGQSMAGDLAWGN